MKKIILIDDEPLARSLVAEYLQKHHDLEIVAECSNGFEGLKSIAQHNPDLVFLDVQMPKINGFEMLELLAECPPIIFTTAFDAYAIKAFEANAIDYLLKPFGQERFDAAVEKWKSKDIQLSKTAVDNLVHATVRQPEERQRIVIKEGAEIRIVPVADIVYLEAYDDYVKIFTQASDRYFLKKKTMNYYDEVLDQDMFFRSHRSFILNIQQLTRIESFEKNSYLGIMKNGKQVPISRTSYGRLKELLGV